MFIDPASVSTGWALFVGKELRRHGTIATPRDYSVYRRLYDIGEKYHALSYVIGDPDEVHIEQLVRCTHIYTHYSVGVIGTTFGLRSEVRGDVPIQSWQKYTNWKTDREPLAEFKNAVASEDELAAIGMGIYWTKRYL